jgi:beta-glucosidase
MHELSIEDKAALVVGAGFWSTAEVGGIPSISITDGPHGIRKPRGGGDQYGVGESAPATCFPPAVALGSTWNAELVERIGSALGVEARAQDVAVLLGPGVNIKRSPLCGRNFEYFSEDPLVSGVLGAAWVRGIQSQGVGAALKHFAANNQETNRMTVSAEVDERTLRELYFPAFESIVRGEQPWTVMCSYNRINGVLSSENRWLLTDVLRDEWGFDGLVVSDWGAVDSRVAALRAGVDLEMPGPQTDSTTAVVSAVRAGKLDERLLDESAARVRRLVERTRASSAGTQISIGAHHALAREAAAESIVLLRNEGSLLPLATAQNIAIIGELARSPRFQGAGSSQVVPTRVDSPLEAISSVAPVEFAAGYRLERKNDSDELLREAIAVASRSDVAVVFVGLPPGDESEGYDRQTIDLPASHVTLLAAVAAANPRTVVVLSNGGVVTLEPWHDSVPAIVEAWLLGQAAGSAIADVLFGKVSPSGRLAESIPFRLQDNPTFLNFPGENDLVRYGEGIFVGYRYYETADVAVRYPFGFGLSYSSFEYSQLVLSSDRSHATVTVTNTGTRTAKDVVQLYVSAPLGKIPVPRRELRGFAKVSLDPGESRTLDIHLDARAFSYFDVPSGSWMVAGGNYRIEIGRSSSDIVLSTTTHLAPPKPGKLTLESPVSHFLEHPLTGPILVRAVAKAGADEEEGGTSLLDMVRSMPMRRLLRFPGVDADPGQIRRLVNIANNPVVRTVAGWVLRLRERR